MITDKIKAPEKLKQKTLNAMKKEASRKRGKIRFKLLAAAGVCLIFGFTVSASDIFSGAAGDSLSLCAQYMGDGKIQLDIENLSKKELRLSENVKLEQWSTGEEIAEFKQKMHVIEGGEKSTVVFDLSKQFTEEEIKTLEEPLEGTDWYYIEITNNKFLYGHSWMASFVFSEMADEENEYTGESLWHEMVFEDNTNIETIEKIKESFNFQLPLKEYKISMPYSDYMENGEYAHPSLDMAAEIGTEIYAVSTGTVTETGFDKADGNYIVIDHGEGLVSKYCHCRNIFKQKGDYIEMDDVIADVGASGNAAGAFLEFEIIKDGIPSNPQYLFE